MTDLIYLTHSMIECGTCDMHLVEILSWRDCHRPWIAHRMVRDSRKLVFRKVQRSVVVASKPPAAKCKTSTRSYSTHRRGFKQECARGRKVGSFWKRLSINMTIKRYVFRTRDCLNRLIRLSIGLPAHNRGSWPLEIFSATSRVNSILCTMEEYHTGQFTSNHYHLSLSQTCSC